MKKVFTLIATTGLSLLFFSGINQAQAGTYREMVGKEDTITILKKAGMLDAMAENCDISYEKKDGLYTIIHDTILQASTNGKIKTDLLESTYKGAVSFYSSYTPELCTETDIDKLATEIDLWNTSWLYQKVQVLYDKPQELQQLSSDYIYRHNFVANGMKDYDAGYDNRTGKIWIYHPMNRAQCMKEASPYRKQSCNGSGLKEEVIQKP